MAEIIEIIELEHRLRARERPDGWPVMYQSWDKLLFLHWKMPVDAVRPLIPEPIKIDTFDGAAWVSVTPLTIYGVRPPFVPPIPLLSSLHELNVRTYVHYDGVPGVWFFSLDANNSLAVAGAKMLFKLPYFNADIEMKIKENSVIFDARRSMGNARLYTKWTIGDQLPPAEPGSLDFFLLERYCLYTADEKNAYKCRIHHQPWPLQETARLDHLRSNVVEAAGLPPPVGEPMLNCGGPVDVEVWPLENVAAVGRWKSTRL